MSADGAESFAGDGLAAQETETLEKLGVASLSIAGIIGLCLLLAVAFYYKLAVVGSELLFGSAVGALILFLLASIVLFAYSKYFLTVDYTADTLRQRRDLTTPTSKLLNDPALRTSQRDRAFD